MINGAPAMEAAAGPVPGPADAVPPADAQGPAVGGNDEQDIPPPMNGGIIIYKPVINAPFTINLPRQ